MEKNPFALVRDGVALNGRERFTLYAGGLSWETSPNLESLQQDADRMNEWVEAWVEAREAQLHGRISNLRLVAAELGDAAHHLLDPRRATPRGGMAEAAARVRESTERVRLELLAGLDEDDEYVKGDVACGLALDLGMWMGTVRELQVMLDAVTSGELGLRGSIAAFLRAKGIAEDEPYEGVIHQLRDALRAGINWMATAGSSSAPEFRKMNAAFDASARDRLLADVARHRTWSEAAWRKADDAALLAEVRRRGLKSTGEPMSKGVVQTGTENVDAAAVVFGIR